MSSTTLNPTTRSSLSVSIRTSDFLHPDYVYWSPHWESIRDAEIGEIEIKRKGQLYLPKQAGQDDQQYKGYLQRAVFYNMTAKTLNSLYGTVFKRNPNVSGLTKPLLERTKKSFSKDGMSLHLTAKTAVKEVLSVGRFGMLVDADQSGRGKPYVACYTAENILDWHQEEIDGEWKYTRVVLREVSYAKERSGSIYDFTSRFRVLVLTADGDGNHFYEQHIHEAMDGYGLPDVNVPPVEIIVPTVRGEPLDHIPFVVIGPFTNHPDIQKPPILDIVCLNLSHYQSYTILEQARFYTANPVYYTTTGGDDEGGGEYYVGPDVVWELGKDGKAGIIEFQGHGLNSLEKALEQKEAQISAIGGRMMPGAARGAAESDNSLKMKEQNEQTLLLNLSDTADEGFTQILQWWADWNNASSSVIAKVSFELNRDFLLKDIGAREFRAIHQMYADGVIPVDVVYEYLRKAEVIPDWMDADEYKKLLTDSKQFPHMVDVLARMKDYPDAKSFLEHKMQREMFAHQAREVQPGTTDPDQPRTPSQARAGSANRQAPQSEAA